MFIKASATAFKCSRRELESNNDINRSCRKYYSFQYLGHFPVRSGYFAVNVQKFDKSRRKQILRKIVGAIQPAGRLVQPIWTVQRTF